MVPYLVALLVVLVGVVVLVVVLTATRRVGEARGVRAVAAEPAATPPAAQPAAGTAPEPRYVSPPRDGRPLEEAVRLLADSSPVPLVVALSGLPTLEQETADAAYAAVAECLENTSRHADAVRAWVRAEQYGSVLRIGIGDDGRGGADPHGPGLRTLQERVDELGGTIQVHSPAGGPTLISIELPLPTAAE